MFDMSLWFGGQRLVEAQADEASSHDRPAGPGIRQRSRDLTVRRAALQKTDSDARRRVRRWQRKQLEQPSVRGDDVEVLSLPYCSERLSRPTEFRSLSFTQSLDTVGLVPGRTSGGQIPACQQSSSGNPQRFS